MILAVSSRGVAGGVSIRGLLLTGGPAGTGQPRKANSKHSFHHDLSGSGSVLSATRGENGVFLRDLDGFRGGGLVVMSGCEPPTPTPTMVTMP